MKTVAIETPSEVGARAGTASRVRSRAMLDFAELVKARLTLLVLVTTAVGYYLGARGPVAPLELFHVVFGTAMAAAGAAALNQWWERETDAHLYHHVQRRIVQDHQTSTALHGSLR